MDYYYVVSTKDNSADQFLHMFWCFHDFRIIEVNYSAIKDTVNVLFEYDDRKLRILLCFEGHVQFYVECIDFETDWIFDAALHEYKNQLRWINCDMYEVDILRPDERITFFQGDRIKWAIVDKEGNTLPVPDDLLHQCWKIYNYKTKHYEEEYHDFTVIPV